MAECTAVAAIQLRMRMRILTRSDNSLATFGRQISNEKLRMKRCEGIRCANANGFANEMADIFVLAAEIPGEWTFATKFASDCECDGLVHSVPWILWVRMGSNILAFSVAFLAFYRKKARKGRAGFEFHAQYDWTNGAPDNGNEWRKFRAVPRSYPLRSLGVCTFFPWLSAPRSQRYGCECECEF